jgi:nucleoid DNA-binding protein
LVELVLKETTGCLEKRETLASFGSFMERKKSQRVGRNPKTGIEVPISPRRDKRRCQPRIRLSKNVPHATAPAIP